MQCCHIVYDESTLQKYAFFKLTSRFTATKCDENAKKTTLAHIIAKSIERHRTKNYIQATPIAPYKVTYMYKISSEYIIYQKKILSL